MLKDNHAFIAWLFKWNVMKKHTYRFSKLGKFINRRLSRRKQKRIFPRITYDSTARYVSVYYNLNRHIIQFVD